MTDPKSLPVYKSKNLILNALNDNQVIIVESPTGSGKTTQIPLILKEAGYCSNGTIGITQPRRIATLSISEYINRQIESEKLPEGFCAYKMRFWDTTNPNTKIKILTDGMLLQELKTDPFLSKYSVIMVDEAHERSLNIDFILGLLKEILSKRQDLKLIISSATINTKVFSQFYSINGKAAPVISIDSRTYNVDVKYFPLQNSSDLKELSYSVCQIINSLIKKFKLSSFKEKLDTLVFLSGEIDIKDTLAAIYSNCDYHVLQIYPLYGRLSKEEQEKVFEETKPGKIKIVLATNIAETSLTIDGIRVVIDSGLSKINYYNQFDYTSALVTRPISKSSAMQRTGRAGRTADGTCFRLYSKEEFENKQQYTQEEILRTDLSEVVLRMIDLGIKDIEHFNFITKPQIKSLVSGEKTLRLLNAIDENRNLTETGKLMVCYPLLPRHSRCMVEALRFSESMIKPVSVCISFLSCKTPFVLPPGEEDYAREAHSSFSSEYGDFIAYQFIYRRYLEQKTDERKTSFCERYYLDKQCMDEIVHVSNQLCEISSDLGLKSTEFEPHNNEDYAKNCLKCLIPGLLQYVCIRKKGSEYRTLNTDDIYIHPGSAYFRRPPQYLLAGEIVQTTKMYARTVSPIEEGWINQISPKLVQNIKVKQVKEDKFTREKANKSISSTKQCNIFGFDYPVVYSSGKKPKPIAVIPLEDLYKLSRAYRKASRRPKNIDSTILYKGYFIHYGEKLSEVLSLSGRIKNEQIISNLPQRIYYPNDFEDIKKHLGILMNLCPLSKFKNRLGFVELVTSGKGMFFHVNSNFSQAINNTAYSLLNLIDLGASKPFKEAYNKIVRLLD